MARLGYVQQTLYPVIVMGEGEVAVMRRLNEACSGNERLDMLSVRWFNNARFKAGVLEMGGLHCLRACRVWGGLGLAVEANPETQTVNPLEKHPHINDGQEPIDEP